MSTSHNGSPSGKNGSSVADLVKSPQPDVPAAPADPAGGAEAAAESVAPPASEVAKLPDFVALLPEQIWYLTSSGKEMWCRRPYGFFFSSSEAAIAFAATSGSAFELTPIGVNSKELVSAQGIDAMRNLGVHRIFIDPRIDPQSGDVFGRILRIEPTQTLQ